MANRPDLDSRIMKTRRGWVQDDNAQAVVTRDQIILAADITNAANDVRQLGGILAQAEDYAVVARDAVPAVRGPGFLPAVNEFDPHFERAY